MKMKEICQKSGLTERAVRFYIERKLVSPNSYEQRERTYYEFTDEHLTQLRNIALLRRCGFSIDAIAEMNASPDHIPSLIRSLWEETRSRSDELRTRLEILDNLSRSPAISLTDLARQLQREYSVRALPDLTTEPDFGRFDEPAADRPTPEETRRYMSGQLSFYGHGRLKLLIAAIVLCVAAIIGSVMYRHYTDHVTTLLFVPSVTLSEKTVENREYHATLTVYPNDFHKPEDCYQLPVRFEEWTLYNSTVSDIPYAAANLEISMPKREAVKRGLYDKATGKFDFEAVLADEILCRQYTTVSYLQGDMK